MLDKCVRDQWSIDDLDWSIPPPQLPRDKEEAVVQYFTDMAGIELLAGALFEVQRDKTPDPTLKKIFATFVADEKRHSAVAARLAGTTTSTTTGRTRRARRSRAFRPHFLALVRNTSPEIANAYITSGELILDVALLRSLDDYVADEMSHQAMHLINRDESRHIAIDFHMTEHYCSDEYLAEIARRPRPTRARDARGMARGLATHDVARQAVPPGGVPRADGPHRPIGPARPRGVQADPARAAQAHGRARRRSRGS